jgi:DNA-binding transcriptional LysR family regulator
MGYGLMCCVLLTCAYVVSQQFICYRERPLRFVAARNSLSDRPWRRNAVVGGYSPTINDLVSRWKSVARFTLRSPYLRRKSPLFLLDIMWVPTPVWTLWRRQKSLSPFPHAGNRNRAVRYLIQWIKRRSARLIEVWTKKRLISKRKLFRIRKTI